MTYCRFGAALSLNICVVMCMKSSKQLPICSNIVRLLGSHVIRLFGICDELWICPNFFFFFLKNVKDLEEGKRSRLVQTVLCLLFYGVSGCSGWK